MNATIIKSLKSGSKAITGQVLQDGANRITLAIIDKNGNKHIKGFAKSNYTIRYH
jgi:hypothetical protein